MQFENNVITTNEVIVFLLIWYGVRSGRKHRQFVGYGRSVISYVIYCICIEEDMDHSETSYSFRPIDFTALALVRHI